MKYSVDKTNGTRLTSLKLNHPYLTIATSSLDMGLTLRHHKGLSRDGVTALMHNIDATKIWFCYDHIMSGGSLFYAVIGTEEQGQRINTMRDKQISVWPESVKTTYAKATISRMMTERNRQVGAWKISLKAKNLWYIRRAARLNDGRLVVSFDEIDNRWFVVEEYTF